jgi:hypothetical protein
MMIGDRRLIRARGVHLERFDDRAIWEPMYFCEARPPCVESWTLATISRWSAPTRKTCAGTFAAMH